MMEQGIVHELHADREEVFVEFNEREVGKNVDVE